MLHTTPRAEVGQVIVQLAQSLEKRTVQMAASFEWCWKALHPDSRFCDLQRPPATELQIMQAKARAQRHCGRPEERSKHGRASRRVAALLSRQRHGSARRAWREGPPLPLPRRLLNTPPPPHPAGGAELGSGPDLRGGDTGRESGHTHRQQARRSTVSFNEGGRVTEGKVRQADAARAGWGAAERREREGD